MTLFYSLLALTLCSAALCATDVILPHTETLDADGKFKIAWFVDDNDVLELEAVVETTGWIALGFSPNGGMPGSDIVMAWIDDDGTQHLSDRHATGNALPVEDAHNNVELLELYEDEGKTTLRFRRHLNTCDESGEDATIVGTSRLIYAYHDEKPVNGIPAKHLAGRRSVRSVNIAQYEPPQIAFPEAPEDVKYVDVRFEQAVTPAGERTRYWWRGFRVPDELRNNTAHIIGYDALIDGEEAEAHHMLLYMCHQTLTDAELAYVGNSHSHNLGGLDVCNFAQPVAAWAVGGEAVLLGSEYGFPLGGQATRETLLLELHLDIADLAEHTTSAGVRLYYTHKLRPNDAAIVAVGGNVDDFLVSPPGMVSERIGYCTADCTSATLPEDGVTIVASLLHMHTLGAGMRTQHVRADGSELPPIESNAHYDFNLQQFLWLKEPRKLQRGDSLITTCTYDATERAELTLGGESTSEEMCLHYLFVYPPPLASVCLSTGSSALVGDLVQRNAFGGDVIGADQRLDDFLESVADFSNLDPALRAAEASGKALFTPVCVAPSQQYLVDPQNLVAAVNITSPYVEPDVCALRPPTTTAASTTTSVNANDTTLATTDADVDSDPSSEQSGPSTEGVIDSASSVALGAAALLAAGASLF